jgi:hypothetical protein
LIPRLTSREVEVSATDRSADDIEWQVCRIGELSGERENGGDWQAWDRPAG